MQNPFLEFSSENFTQDQFDIPPPSGYVIPKNAETGKELPYCCENHHQFYDHLTKLFEKFPDCCKFHGELAKNPIFRAEKYKNVSNKIVTQCAFTQHIIIDKINGEDWWVDIRDYIDYNAFSFGHPSIGLEHYLSYLRNCLQDSSWREINKVPTDKAKKVADFIINQLTPKSQPKSDTSWSILADTYRKWFKIFPFELSYFSDLKIHFEKQLPFIKENLHTNKYSGLTAAKLHTKDSLIEFLMQLTNDILKAITSVDKYKNWTVKDADRIKLELIVEHRKLKIKQGYHNSSKDEETRYRKVLKDWFKDEKKFIDEIKPLLLVGAQKTKLINFNEILSRIIDSHPSQFVVAARREYEAIDKSDDSKAAFFSSMYGLIKQKTISVDTADSESSIILGMLVGVRQAIRQVQRDISIQQYDLEEFVSNDITRDSPDTKDKTKENEIQDITVLACALMHVYLAMFNGKAVTQHNKNDLAKMYGYKNGNQLRNAFTLFQNEDKRLDLNPSNKKSANAHLDRFEKILPLLENENPKAYCRAKSEYDSLKKEYNKYY